MKTGLTTLLILNCLLSLTLAVSDDNICAESCQYCCRNKQCKSQSECKGNYQPFIILGCIAGGLIGLFIARRVYVHYRNKGMIARGEDPKAKKGTRSRWRSRKGSKSPAKEKKRKESSDRKKKEKVKERPSSSSKSSKPSKPRSLKDADAGNKSKGDIYLQIDNESVLSAEDVKSVTNKNAPLSSRNELKPTSKNEILVKSDTNLEDKDRLNPYKQNRIPDMPAKKDSKENKNKDDKRSTSKGKPTSSSTNKDNKKPASSMKDSKMAGSMRESKAAGNASAKDRGRSRDAGKGGERSTSQKKPTSSGPNNRDKSRGQSAGRKDRV